MRSIQYLAGLLLCLALGLGGPSAHAQQTAAQAYAQQKYNEFNFAREATWRARSQGQAEYVVNQLLANERSAWDAYTQAQNAANAEANQIVVNQYAAQVDTAIATWSNFIRTIYDRRDVNAYANDPNYRAGYDQWVQNWTVYGNNVIQQLSAYRQQLVGAQTPPAPPTYDPRYTGSDLGPIAESYDPRRGYGPVTRGAP